MPAMDSTFHCSKQVLVRAVLLSHLASKAAFARVVADASRTHIPATSEVRLTTMGFLFSQAKPSRNKILNIQIHPRRARLPAEWTDHNLLVTAFLDILKL
jgi:hypothetical protein